MSARTEAEQEAIDIHESIVADYERAIAKGKVDKDGCRRRVTDHLLETVGGLTLAEIEADLTATKGELWSSEPYSDGAIDAEAILEYLKAPGTAVKRINALLDEFDLTAYRLARRIDNERRVVFESDGKFFLWRQRGIDYGARLLRAEEAYNLAKSEFDSIQQSPEELDALEAEVKSIQEQIDALGFLKFGEKKALKKKLAQAKDDVIDWKQARSRKIELEDELPALTSELDSIKAQINNK